MPPTLQAITLRVVVWLEGKHLAPLLEGGSGSSDGNGGGDDLMKAFLEAEKHTAGKVIAMEKFSKLCCALYVCVCQLSAASAVCCIRCMLKFVHSGTRLPAFAVNTETTYAGTSIAPHSEVLLGVGMQGGAGPSAKLLPEWLAPSVRHFLAAPDSDSTTLSSFVKELSPGIFSFDLFSPEFCVMLLAQIDVRNAIPPEILDTQGPCWRGWHT